MAGISKHIVGVVALLFSVAVPHGVDPATAWTHGIYQWNGNLTQVGPWFNNFGGDFPFINYVLDAQDWVNSNNSGNVNVANMDPNGYPTSNTELSSGPWKTTFSIPSQAEKPGNYTEQWIGNATINVSIGGTVTSAPGCSVTGNQVAGTNCVVAVTPTGAVISLTVHAIGSPGLSKLQFCLASDCQKLLTGEIFNADFKNTVCQFGVIRYLDKGNFNFSNEATWEDRKAVTSWNYNTPHYPASEVTSNQVTLNTGAAYTLAFPGFSLSDKAHVIAQLATTISSFPATLNVNGTGDITIASPFGGAWNSGEGNLPTAEWLSFTYDASLNVWMAFTANTTGNGINDGWPPEVMVQLANECRAHPYFPSPYLAMDPPTDYTSSLSAYVKANLAPTLIPRIEGPNETWNASFYVTTYANHKEFLRTGNASDHDNWYGRIISQACQTVSATYGNDRTKYQCIAGMSPFGEANPVKGGGGQDNKLASPEFVSNGGSAAYNWVTHVATNGYWNTGYNGTVSETGWAYQFSISPSNTLLDDYFAGSTLAATNFTLPVLNTMYGQYATYVASYSSLATIGLTQYEGGNNQATPGTQTASVTSVTTGNPTVITVGSNAWNYICNTASLCTGGAPTASLSGFAAGCGLNGLDPAVTAATATTVTVSIDSTAFTGCTTGTATYDNSHMYLGTFENAARIYSGMAPYELTNLQNFHAAGGIFPAEYDLSGSNQWAAYLPDIYQTSAPKITAVQQFQQTPYLLKRDLDPSSNDNTPMWLNEAA